MLESVQQAKEFTSNDSRRNPKKWDFYFSIHEPVEHFGEIPLFAK